MNTIDQAILNALTVNMRYIEGESIAIVAQKWDKHLGEKTRAEFDSRYQLAQRMFDVYNSAGFDVRFVEYIPEEARHGADATKVAYESMCDATIVFMPTAYSLTHTPFRVAQTDRGARVASMPMFTLDMFEEGGPMSVDYDKVEALTKEVTEKLQGSKYVRITGFKTDIVVEIDQDHVHTSSGILKQPGTYGNLPGAESYVPPTHEGNSNGYFTVPVGWGGSKSLEYQATFYVENGRFVDVVGENKEAQDWIDGNVKPLIFEEYGAEKNADILAELGIGTNTNVTPEYIEEHGWNLLLGEKIYKSHHFANGNSKAMGGVNDVRTHIDWVVPNSVAEYNYQPS